MDGNGSKLLLAVVGAAVVIGGVYAVRNLADSGVTKDKIEVVDEPADSRDSGTTIETIDTDTVGAPSKPAARPDRTISRGDTAATINVTPATTITASAQRFANMADDATTAGEESEADEIASLVQKFKNSTDPEDRVDAADELGMIDSVESIRAVLDLLKTEQDPEVLTSLLEAMQGLEALEMTSSEVLAAAKAIRDQSTDPDVRMAAQDLLGDLSTAEAVQALRDWRNSPNIDPAEKLSVAENLMRISAFEPDMIPESEIQDLNNQLRLDYQAGPDAAFRSQAIMALAINGRNNVEFFQEAVQTEQDPGLKGLLERLIRMFTTPPPATPPPGTQVTPVPTP